MNARILEIISNPEIIEKEDLDLLNSEIRKYPYLQNLRALHLLGTHQFDAENYQKVLSVTAAYTTDKKILYQLINKKEAPVFSENKFDEAIEPLNSDPKPTFDKVTFVPKPSIKPVFVEGSLNRILFEGEEDFLERENEQIDIESTLEAGKIVTQTQLKDTNNIRSAVDISKNSQFAEAKDAENFSAETVIPENRIETQETIIEDSDQNSFHGIDEILQAEQAEKEEEILPEIDSKEITAGKFEEAEDAESFTRETIIDENKIEAEEPILEDSAKISFHGSQDFLPEIKINSTISNIKYEVPKAELSKQELEMQQLIASVEAKMKASKKVKTEQNEPIVNHEVNFTEHHRIENSISEKENTKEKVLIEKIIPTEKIAEENPEIETEIVPKTIEVAKEAWKPMNFSGNIPDSVVKEDFTKKTEEKIIPAKESSETEILEEQEKPAVENELEKKVSDSNFPTFLNTWEKWLKIERIVPVTVEEPVISKEEVKNLVIEKFIEKEPRISKLKEESDFVIKEKGTNISHLMTETLANLYVEQKLYAKAIKAFETLAGKHPEKAKYFKEKIREIKEIRKNP